MGNLMTIAEAAEELGISAQGVYGLIKVHNIKTKLRKKSIIKRQAVKMVDIDDLRKARKKESRA